jgi:hypothetical protein
MGQGAFCICGPPQKWPPMGPESGEARQDLEGVVDRCSRWPIPWTLEARSHSAPSPGGAVTTSQSSSRRRGRIKEIRPGTWRIRVYFGHGSGGSALFGHQTVQGTRRDASSKRRTMACRSSGLRKASVNGSTSASRPTASALANARGMATARSSSATSSPRPTSGGRSSWP